MASSAEIFVSAGLDDVVFCRARAEPGAVMLRRRAPRGGWQDVTAGQFRAEVAALATGIIGAGIACLVTADPDTLEFWKR